MSEKLAKDLASRLADAALRLSSWANDPPEARDPRSVDRVFGQLDETVSFVESAVQDILAGKGKKLAGPTPVWSAERAAKSSDLDDPLEGMRGHSRAFTIPELLSFVSVCHKTGILRVHTDEENFLVQLEGGMVVYARSDRLAKGEHLAEILIANGVAAESIESFEQTGPLLPESLARFLQQNGLATSEDVRAAIEHQVHIIFRRLTSARDAYFRFYGGAKVRTEPEVRLNINKLLIESARCSDEEFARESERSASDLVPIDPEEFAKYMLGEEVAEDGSPVDEDVEVDEASFRELLDGVIEEGKLELPLLDAAASELLVLTWDEQVDAETLEEHIGRDQGLCAHILRVANSAAFAPVVPVASVSLAITRLGMDRIREIALALTVRQKAFEVPGWEDEVRLLWRRSAVTSGFAKALSRRLGSTPQRGSLLGLLQDVGKPVVLNTLCEIEADLGVELVNALAVELMDEYHGRVGSLLARHWSLPEWLEAVLLHHHDFDAVDEHREDVLVAHLADHLAAWAEDRDAEAVDALTQLEACAELGLTAEQVRNVLEETDAILAFSEIYA